MKKQYLATITRGDGSKEYAMMRYAGFKRRYANTLEEAVEAIKFCENEYVEKDINKVTTNYCGSIGISCALDTNTYNALKVVSSEIKVREVTEWEIVV